MRSRYGRRAFRASPIRCVGERIKVTGVPEFREVAWRAWFLSENQSSDSTSRQEQKKLKQENKRLQKELNRKDRALSETAALLVLSKKCQAIWGEKEVD